MRIAIHAGTLRGFGSGAVGRNVLRALSQVARDHELTAWIPKDWGWGPEELGPGVHLISLRGGFASKLITENAGIRRALCDFDVLFSMGDTSLPACPIPHLLMVQQAYLAYRPSDLDFSMSPVWQAKLRAIGTYFRLGLSSTSRLTVQTRDMKDRLCERWSLAPERVALIPSSYALNPRPPRAEADPRYVCYVATPSAHKNFEVLADMMSALATQHGELRCKLTVRPREVPGLVRRARELQVSDRFEFLGRVRSDALGELLASAVALVMPSKLESFGLPYYEAMAVGCPVLAADRAFAREACGPAALYADADSGRDFGAAVARLLRESGLRGQLQAAGATRIQSVSRSWNDIAGAYLELLQELIRPADMARGRSA